MGTVKLKAEFTTLVQQLITDQGKDALLDTGKCKAFLADYAKGEYLNERRLLLQVVEVGIPGGIMKTDDLAAYKQMPPKSCRTSISLLPM
jgi:hypothetical protein